MGTMVSFVETDAKTVGGVMIVTKQEYTITDLDLLTPSQHNSESIWASISLKDHSKIVVGSFYRPPDKGIEPILNLETELSEITEKFRNNSKYTVIPGGVTSTLPILTGILELYLI